MKQTEAPATAGLIAYASLRMPLALLELPLFVLLPNFYSDTLGMELTLVGGILFLSRLADAALDPAIGSTIDRFRSRWHYRRWIWLALPVLAIGYTALLNPPTGWGMLWLWLAVMSMVTYLGYSIASIAYQSWGAQIGQTDAQRARVTGIREAAGLVGVLLAAAYLTPENAGLLCAMFVGLAAVSSVALMRAPVAYSRAAAANQNATVGIIQSLAHLWPNRLFRWLLAAFVINGIATAVPATLVLFYISDILHLADRAPLFLTLYFLAGALGMPLWIGLSARVGLRNTWLLGMGFSVIAFVWALGLGSGDSASFIAICLLTGLALGADLALPPALLASVIASSGDAGKREGVYFGVWNFATKLNLAAAAGLTLPLLSVAGYRPGDAGSLALVLTYAALPCAMKLIAAALLFLAPALDGPTRKPAGAQA